MCVFIENSFCFIFFINFSYDQVPAKSKQEETSTDLFDSSSSTFRETVKLVGVMLAIATLLGLVWHYGIFLPRQRRQRRQSMTQETLFKDYYILHIGRFHTRDG